MKISFITTCKGRRRHLEEVLPLWLAEKPDEIIVVDVGCPDGTADWLSESQYPVKVVRLSMAGFHLAKARNLGAKAAQHSILCFIDADIKVREGFLNWIKEHLTENTYALRARKNAYDGIHEQGTVVCKESDFQIIGGYDEVITSYGGEDHDLYEKLHRSGMRPIYYPQHLMESIPHDDQLRMQFHSVKIKELNSIRGRIYASAKRQVLALFPGKTELPLDLRQKIMERIDFELAQCGPKIDQLAPINLKLDVPAWLPPPYRLSQKLHIELSIKTVEKAK